MKKSRQVPDGPSGASAGSSKRTSGQSGPSMTTGKRQSFRPSRPAEPEATPSNATRPSRKKPLVRTEGAGLTKLTRGELVVRATELGLPVSDSDRRIDLIERIRNRAALKPAGKTKSGTARNPARKDRTAPVSSSGERSLPVSSNPMTPPASVLSEREESAPGWKYFLDISYEPVRRESGHFISILPVDPHRIVAFFAVDWTIDPELSRVIRESGVVLKIRDVTGAMHSMHEAHRQEELPADHIFDIMTGTANRWTIPLWSAHRTIEAWLGYYMDQKFHRLARSKRIGTPRGTPSSRRGTLFQLQEEFPFSTPDTEASWDYSISRRWIKLPTSREIPGGSATP